MGDPLLQDFYCIRDILRLNSAEGIIGEDVLVDLLGNQPASNTRRVDTVLYQLEDIFGLKLERREPAPVLAPVMIIHTQLVQQFQQAQEPSNNIAYKQTAEKIKIPQVQPLPSLPPPVAGPSASKKKTERVQTALNQPPPAIGPSATKKRTERVQPTLNQPSPVAGPSVNKQTTKGAQPTLNQSSPIAGPSVNKRKTEGAYPTLKYPPPASVPRVSERKTEVVQSALRHPPPVACPSANKRKIEEFQTATNSQTPVAGPSGVKCRKLELSQAKDSMSPIPPARDPKELLAQTIYNNILNVLKHIHPIFAAFKASEFVLAQDPLIETNSFLEKAVMRTETFVTAEKMWYPPPIMNPVQSDIFESIQSKFIDGKVQFLVSSLPHVQPIYLEKIAKDLNGNDQKIEEFIIEVCEGKRVVPLLKDGSKYGEIVENFFTVQQFLEMYEDPINHFKNDGRITDERYRTQAVNQLKLDFRFASVYIIKKAFRENNFHYTPAFLKLNESKNFKDRKTKRSHLECYEDKATDEFLLQEIAIVRIKEDIEAYQKQKKQNRLEILKVARTRGKLMDCPICCEDELVDSDFVLCQNGHGICRQCVKRQSEELIGQMKNHVNCLFPSCEAEYSLKDLKEVLTKTCFMHLEKRRQAEEIIAANIDGLESCPFCEYCEVPPDNTLIFNCKNPGCTKTSCRKCREPYHGQLSCEENAMKQRLASYVEMKMTEALVRECPTCKKKFVKLDGCNKMTCVCGTVICYICRAKITGYNHFYNANAPQLPNQSNKGKCLLYSDTNKMHEEDVAKGAAQARAELALQNPNVRVNLVLEKLK